MKKLMFLMSMIISSPLIAQINSVKSWKEYSIPFNYHFANDIIKNRGCNNEILKETIKKNPAIDFNKMKIGDMILLPSCNGSETLYQSNKKEKINDPKNSDKISSWNDYLTEKGFILSKKLANDQKCSLIWTYQIYEFKKNNPSIKNVNKIAKNKKIKLQTCKELESIIAKDQEEKKAAFANIQSTNSYLVDADNRFDIYLGSASISNKKYHFASIGLRSNIIDQYGFKLKLANYGSNIFFSSDFELKSDNIERQKYLAIGISEFHLSDSPIRSINTLYANAGMIFRPSNRSVTEIVIGANISDRIALNAELSSLRRIKQSTTWIGGFIQTINIGNPKENLPKNLIIGGLKVSF